VKRKRERVLMIWWFSADVLDEATKMRLLLPLTEDGGAASRTGFSSRGWWVSKEDGDAVQLKVAMPGLGKEHVKMRAEKNVLVIKGEGDKADSEGDDDKVPARYIYRIGLPSQAFKMDQIKAEMKNGVLMVTVPKIKDEERKDVFEIKIE